MKETLNPKRRAWIANFSDIDLQVDHQLNFNAEDLDTILKKIRTYADMPFVYVVAKENEKLVSDVLSKLKAIRSRCYPYALFAIDQISIDFQGRHLEIVRVDSRDGATIRRQIDAYVGDRFHFDEQQLFVGNSGALPAKVDVAIIGAGITGIYAANRIVAAGLTTCVVEKRDRVGGIWSQFANTTSQVNSSECAYRLFEKAPRINSDHSATREILEDITSLSHDVADKLFLQTEVKSIEKTENGYRIAAERAGRQIYLDSTGVILAINDRVGPPREIEWPNQSVFEGKVVSGISNDTIGLDWRGKNVVIVGMGAFAIENARTALEGGARQVTVVCRRHGTICPKIIDYLNFATPYDESFQHDKKSNLKNMMYWKKLYDLSGATKPECWMGKVKHDGHTISVSDIWFIGHYLKKIKTITGEISSMTPKGVLVNGQQPVDADIVVNCVGFERNTLAAEAISGYRETYNNNYLDKDFFYLADAYIDADAFNSLFGSSVLEMVKFYMEVYIKFFNSQEFDHMINTEGIRKVPIQQRSWSHYIEAATTLMNKYPDVRAFAQKQVDQRTINFLEAHDLETYIAENKREWIDMHTMLAGKPIPEEECMPYVFEKLL
jgi:hypothetical protein